MFIYWNAVMDHFIQVLPITLQEKWSRAKKVAYFRKDWKTLHEKARCQNSTSHKLRSSEDETL